MWAPIYSPGSSILPRFSGLPSCVFWPAKCIRTAAMLRWLNCQEGQFRQSHRGMRGNAYVVLRKLWNRNGPCKSVRFGPRVYFEQIHQQR